MELRLDDKVAVVTGASRGIGAAIARLFAQSGAQVLATARDGTRLARTADEFDEGIECFAADVSDPDAPAACVAAAEQRFGAVDILVNTVATNPSFGPLRDLDAAAMARMDRTNVHPVVTWTQAALRGSMGRSGGTVVNIASVGAFLTQENIGYYNASKAAVVHLTRELALELAPDVRVNAIAPGLTRTRFARVLWEPFEERIAERVPMRRIGEPADIAAAALFLASPAAAWVTGHTLVVDGGTSLAAQL